MHFAVRVLMSAGLVPERGSHHKRNDPQRSQQLAAHIHTYRKATQAARHWW